MGKCLRPSSTFLVSQFQLLRALLTLILFPSCYILRGLTTWSLPVHSEGIFCSFPPPPTSLLVAPEKHKSRCSKRLNQFSASLLGIAHREPHGRRWHWERVGGAGCCSPVVWASCLPFPHPDLHPKNKETKRMLTRAETSTLKRL